MLPHHCQVCHYPLARWEPSYAEPYWAHPSHYTADHDPVPVPTVESDAEIHYVCDFCSTPEPRWAYRAQTYAAKIGNAVHHSIEGWAACDACADLIDAERWEDLRKYALSPQTPLGRSIHGAPSGSQAVAIVQAEFRKHRVSGRVPVAEDH